MLYDATRLVRGKGVVTTLEMHFSYITQVTSTTIFVVVRTFGARESVSLNSTHLQRKVRLSTTTDHETLISEPVRRSLDMEL